MENIVQSNNRDLRLVAVKVGVLSTLRLALPDVPANATRVEVIVTNGDTHTAYGAHLDTDTERWLVDVAAAQFPSCGKQKYEIAYLLDGKQFWDGAGFVTVEDATTGGITPSPAPDPARYVVTRINGYGAPNPDGEVRIPRTFVGTEDPTTTDGFIEFDQLFNRVTGTLFVLCSVGGTMTWVKTSGAVSSVNGMVGGVVLTADDVLDDAQKAAANSGIKADLVPKVLTVDESTATKKIVLGDKTFTSFAELTALVQNGVTRLKYYVTGATGRPVLYTAHLCDASSIRFDATGTLGETVYTRSIAITKDGKDGIAVSVGALTQVAKKSDVPLVVAPSASAPTGQSADAKVVGSVLKGFFRDDGPPIFYFDEYGRLNGNFISNGVFVEDYFAGNGGAVSCDGVGKLAFHVKAGLLVILDANGNEVARFVKSTDIADATKLTPVLDADGRVTGYKLGDKASPVLLTDDAKAALFAGADFIAAVKKYGGTQIKEDEKGFYYEVDEEA